MAGTISGNEYTGAYKNTGIVSRSKRCTISGLTTGDVIPLLPVKKGEVCLAFTVKLITRPDKVLTATTFGPDNSAAGMLANIGTAFGSSGTDALLTEYFGAGALLALTAVEDADNTIDGTFTVTAGPCTTDLVFDVQALFLSTSLA
jgi:hypothetical protein